MPEPAGRARSESRSSRPPRTETRARSCCTGRPDCRSALWIGRRVRGSSDFFVAGALAVGAADLLDHACRQYRRRLDGRRGRPGLQRRHSGWWWNGSAAIGSIVLACGSARGSGRVARRTASCTVGDFLEYRYGPPVRGIARVAHLGRHACHPRRAADRRRRGPDRRRRRSAMASAPPSAACAMTVYFTAGGLLSSAWVNAVQLRRAAGGLRRRRAAGDRDGRRLDGHCRQPGCRDLTGIRSIRAGPARA